MRTKALLVAVWLGVGLSIAIGAGVGADASAAARAPEQPDKCRLKGDPLMFGVASFLIPGLGQFMVGEDGRGLQHLIVAVALPTVVLVAAVFLGAVAPPLGVVLYLASPLIYFGWSIYSAVDAYGLAAQRCAL